MGGPRTRYTTFVDDTSFYWKGTPGNRYPEAAPQVENHYIKGKDDLLVSQGNAYHLLGKSGRTIGGPFWVIKNEYHGTYIEPRPYSYTLDPHEPGFHFEGPVLENVGHSAGFGWPTAYYSSSSELEALGTTAIANTIPTNPLSGLFVSLGELKRDGIPSLFGVQSWRNRTQAARAAGSEYLNAQFGWIPLVNELRSFTNSVTNSDELIAQYARNSGRKIKRSFNLPSVTETTITEGTGRSTSPLNPGIYDGTSYGDYTLTTTKSKRRWFEASFSYYLPPLDPSGDNFSRNEQLANYLFGTRVTPEGIWDLTPWSWAADWVGNFGDVLHNVGAFNQDGLVMPYAYIMEEGIHEQTYTHPDVRFHTYPGSVEVSATYRTISKRRIPATPYGFGLDIGLFSDRQWSILVALGISRGDKKIAY